MVLCKAGLGPCSSEQCLVRLAVWLLYFKLNLDRQACQAQISQADDVRGGGQKLSTARPQAQMALRRNGKLVRGIRPTAHEPWGPSLSEVAETARMGHHINSAGWKSWGAFVLPTKKPRFKRRKYPSRNSANGRKPWATEAKVASVPFPWLLSPCFWSRS